MTGQRPNSRPSFRPTLETLEDRCVPAGTGALQLSLLGTYEATGEWTDPPGIGAAEVVAYDAKRYQLFSVNAVSQKIDVLNIKKPETPQLKFSIDVSAFGTPNSVAVHKDLVAVAIENPDKQAPGTVAFYNARNGNLLKALTVGALPDMLTFTPDGKYLLVANEGEPSDDYTDDPEGSVSVISLKKHTKRLTNADVKTAGFTAFNGQEAALRTAGVRIFGPGASAAQDFEPEYITVAPDGKTAYVTLQENNAVAVLDIKTATITDILPLGYKDHSVAGNGLDGSDRDGPGNDGKLQIANWQVFGMYQPDGIASFSVGGQTYFVTANEGDARAYSGLNEEARISSLTLDAGVFPANPDLKNNDNIGRLTVTNQLGNTDGDAAFEALYAFGARSFSIWKADGTLVYDSGDDFEQETAAALATFFNSTHDEDDGTNTFDTRSDNKGPEPEAIALGQVKGRTYAFIGLERIGGVMVYDVTDPNAPVFVNYVNNRNFSAASEEDAGDLGPEGLVFISADKSPTKKPLLVVANEVSSTVSIFSIDPDVVII